MSQTNILRTLAATVMEGEGMLSTNWRHTFSTLSLLLYEWERNNRFTFEWAIENMLMEHMGRISHKVNYNGLTEFPLPNTALSLSYSAPLTQFAFSHASK